MGKIHMLSHKSETQILSAKFGIVSTGNMRLFCTQNACNFI